MARTTLLPMRGLIVLRVVAVSVSPGRDALDDEELLTLLDESDPACTAGERGEARRTCHGLLELRLLTLELGNLCLALGERAARVHPAHERLVVEVGNDDQHDDREDARHAAAPTSAPRR